MLFFSKTLHDRLTEANFLLQSKIRQLSIFGAGILVGTSLSVIIPEGVNSIYSTALFVHKKLKLPAANKTVLADELPHSLIGTCLVVGFVFMLLVDQIASRQSTNGSYSTLPIGKWRAPLAHWLQLAVETATNQTLIKCSLPISDSETGHNTQSGQVKRRSSSKITATIGLIVHASADGIALGAAATTAHRDVEFVIFLAIMLHKAPASFGLVSFLLAEGLDKKSIRKHLVYFALSAPLSAFVTYALLGKISAESMAEYNATGKSAVRWTFHYVHLH